MKTIYTLCGRNAGVTHGNYSILNPYVVPSVFKEAPLPIGV